MIIAVVVFIFASISSPAPSINLVIPSSLHHPLAERWLSTRSSSSYPPQRSISLVSMAHDGSWHLVSPGQAYIARVQSRSARATHPAISSIQQDLARLSIAQVTSRSLSASDYASTQSCRWDDGRIRPRSFGPVAASSANAYLECINFKP